MTKVFNKCVVWNIIESVDIAWLNSGSGSFCCPRVGSTRDYSSGEARSTRDSHGERNSGQTLQQRRLASRLFANNNKLKCVSLTCST